MTYTLTARLENVLQALGRVSSLLTRRSLKVQEMHLLESNLSLTLHMDETEARWLMSQLGKLVDVFDLTWVDTLEKRREHLAQMHACIF